VTETQRLLGRQEVGCYQDTHSYSGPLQDDMSVEKDELRQKFCIRAFHEEVLSAGLLPTDVFAGGERLARCAFDTARSRKCFRGLLHRPQTGAMGWLFIRTAVFDEAAKL